MTPTSEGGVADDQHILHNAVGLPLQSPLQPQTIHNGREYRGFWMLAGLGSSPLSSVTLSKHLASLYLIFLMHQWRL